MSKERPRKPPRSSKFEAEIARLQRSRGERSLAKRFLIVCEDSKSAPNYFEALRTSFRWTAGSIRAVGSDGDSQPSQVVKKEAESARSGSVPFDQVWCVIDGDYGDKIPNARAKAEAHGIELAISTQCFEYWILLHFEEYDRPDADCDAVIRRLKSHVPDYDKGRFAFSRIVDRVDDAIERARRLRQPGLRRGDPPERQNPCSEVFRLIEAIREVGV